MTAGRLLIPLLLQLLGVVVIIAEFILPSAGILTVVAVGIIGFSLYLIFTTVSVTAGMVVLAVDLIMIPILVIIGLKLLARSPATLKESLSRAGGVQAQSSELEALLNARGTTLSTLRPSGTALIDGKRVDVVTRGEYVDKGEPVVVAAITGNQVIVAREHTADRPGNFGQEPPVASTR